MNLTSLLRPKKLEDFVGQKHIIGVDKPLYTLIKQGEVPHMVFYGPPGCGKTTLAQICANEIKSEFYYLDATSLKVEEIRKIINQYKNTLLKPTIFIDEIHRLSKTQQEVLLLPMEREDALIIGASTENPYYSLTSGIRSRMMLFHFEKLTKKELEEILDKAQNRYNFSITKEAKEYLLHISCGDAREMLNLIRYAMKNEKKEITLQTIKSLKYNNINEGVSSSETHYDLISALIKSIRGSDIDASLYYLARLIVAGESAEYIARRLVILSSEDIGNANPNALNLATNTLTAVSAIGFPEAKIILSQCVVYLASSPKSNSSYKAIKEAIEYIKKSPNLKVPNNIKQNNKEYLNPHDFGGFAKQRYMQKELKFYNSKGIGFEKTLNEWIEKIKMEKK